MTGFRLCDWTDDMLANANDATAAASGRPTAIFTGNELNALICEVQAWRRENPHKRFVPGPNTIELDQEKWASMLAADLAAHRD